MSTSSVHVVSSCGFGWSCGTSSIALSSALSLVPPWEVVFKLHKNTCLLLSLSLQVCWGSKTFVAQLAVVWLRHFPAEISRDKSQVAMDNHVISARAFCPRAAYAGVRVRMRVCAGIRAIIAIGLQLKRVIYLVYFVHINYYKCRWAMVMMLCNNIQWWSKYIVMIILLSNYNTLVAWLPVTGVVVSTVLKITRCSVNYLVSLAPECWSVAISPSRDLPPHPSVCPCPPSKW